MTRTAWLVAAATVFGGLAFGQCTYKVTDQNGVPVIAAEVPSAGAISDLLNVTTQPGCGWQSTSNASWIQITSGQTGSGSGVASFQVQQNQGASRVGSIVIAGQTITLTQVELLGPSGQIVEFSMAKTPGAAGVATCVSSPPAAALTYAPTDQGVYLWFVVQGMNVGDVVSSQYVTPNGSVYTGAGHSYPSQPTSGGFFTDCDTSSGGLNIFGTAAANLPGQWTVNMYITPVGTNTPVLVLSVPFTITGTNTCSYSLSGPTNTFNGSGGSGTITVTANQGCPWTAVSNSTWIHIGASGQSGSGSGTVPFTVDANTGSARTGTITIAGQTFTVTQAAGAAAGPTISQGGIADPWTGSAGLAPGAWVSIYGSSLSSLTQSWSPAAGAQLPTSLAGVTVTIDSQPAPISFASPGQLNVLVPAAVRTGPISITVNNNGAISAPYTIQSTTYLPAVFANYLPGSSPSRFYVTAVDPVTAQIVGNFSANPAAVHNVHPGEIIDIYGLGFGPTAAGDPFPTTTAFTGAYPIAATLNVSLGGVNIAPLFADYVAPGLYQIRITVPASMTLGDQLLSIIVAGQAQTPNGVFVTIGN